MSEFIKKNMMLVVFLGIAAVAALVLAFFDLSRYHQIGEGINTIEDGDAAIQEINNLGNAAPGEFKDDPQWTEEQRRSEFKKWNTQRKNTRIIKENAERIKSDTAELVEKTWLTQRVFGAIYDEAFLAFLTELKKPVAGDDKNLVDAFNKNLEKIDWKAFHKALEVVLKNQKNAKNLSKTGYNEVFDAVCAEAFKAPAKIAAGDKAPLYAELAKKSFEPAFKVFRDEVQRTTVEDLSDPVAAKAIFLQVLGLQRSFETGMALQIYMEEFGRKLMSKNAIPLAPADRNDEALIRSILMDCEKDKPQVAPDESNVPHIMRRVQIYEDLFDQMKMAKIQELISLKQENLRGEFDDKNKYRTYSFTVTVRGTMEQVRTLLNRLHGAYKNHRVYVMDNFSAEILMTGSGKTSDAKGEIGLSVDMMKHFKAEEDNRIKQEEALKENPKAEIRSLGDGKKPYNVWEDPDYGAPTLGIKDQVQASFTIDYVMYVGDSLPKETLN